MKISDKNIRIARRVLLLMLIPGVIYPFIIPITPYWADILYGFYCLILFFIAHVAHVIPLRKSINP